MGQVTVVFDTNVLISGLGFGGKPKECIDLAVMGDVQMVISEDALDEFRRVLTYDRLPFDEEEQQTLPDDLIRLTGAEVINPEVSVEVIEDDPDDDVFLECALAAGADYIVSGNDHLLDEHPFRGIKIVEPAEFLTLIRD
ncbi:putative toxin-antitoxin system toxin component, PIN family [Haloferax larsenii]|uniref:Putative toxin-antitoxin system toxin component, PIN family n=1 Tax=Haloferax larsenii TaxID=302484 RepID=A0A1H7TXB3_HALLR|nr:putative toxin-antitoxin system toxin component, PIN family [Haloferax larsenii]SEL88587.1 putative toxin-antitoxin system toxin component, PIN family [Haloferax larsenii]